MPRFSLSRLSVLLLASTAFLAATSGAVLSAPAGSLTPLAPLPGNPTGLAYRLSADGTTVVGYAYSGGQQYAVYWSADGAVHALNVAAGSYAFGVSGDGSTILIGDYAPNLRASVYKDGVQTFLPHFTDPSAGQRANAANHDGTVVVGLDKAADGENHAMMWSGPNWATITDLGVLASGPGYHSYAHDVDGLGTTVVGESSSADAFGLVHAFYWQAGSMHDIGQLGFTSKANGISADGTTIVGQQGAAGGVNKAVIWTGAGFVDQTDLGTLGGTDNAANASNANGTIIVGYSSIGFVRYAFRYADGTMADLNTLLSNAGIDMTGIVLAEALDVSNSGDYILADDPTTSHSSYLVYYHDGVAGLTNEAEQQESVDAVGKARQALAIQHDAYFGILSGDLDRHDDGGQIGVLGLVGSAVGGLRGNVGLGNGFSLSGGIADGTSSFGGAGIGNALMGAMAIRYDSDLAFAGFHPFAQLGGGYAMLSGVSFVRPYTGGTGEGTTDGSLGSLYARLGLTQDFDSGDQLSFVGEIGERWLSTEAYSEAFSATNPFPASFAAGTDAQTVGKLSASWTHPFSTTLDVTLHAAVGATLAGSSGLVATTTGFGALTTGMDNAIWAEAGVHVDWQVTANSAIDLYATGIIGDGIGANGHVGAGYHYKF